MDFLDLLELVLVTEPGIHACNLEESNTYIIIIIFLHDISCMCFLERTIISQY